MKHAWSQVPLEKVNPTLSRRVVTGQKLMVAQIELKAGGVVPKHSHPNEQVSYVLSGALRFWIGENVDSPNEAGSIVLRANEVVAIPGDVPHRILVLEDSLTVDIFTPPRADWLAGTDRYLR